MPSVRFNHSIRSQIINKAKTAYEKASPKPEMSAELINLFRRAFTEQPLIKAIAEFKATNQSLLSTPLQSDVTNRFRKMFSSEKLTQCDVIGNETKTDLHGSRTRTRVNFPTPITLPVANIGYCPDLYLSEVETELRTQIEDDFNAFVAKQEAHEQAQKEYNNKIRTLVNSVNTTGQFLEAWPGGLDLIPNDIIQKMHTKTTRKQAVKQIKDKVEFDDSAANAVLMTAKLME